jgi:Outer membrane protein beta-barrel domain
MQAIDLRNKFALYRHQIAFVAFFWLIGFSAQAQLFLWARQHNPTYDDRKFSYGFSIGLHSSAYEVKYSDRFVTPKFDTVHSVLPQYAPGFSLGFLVNYHLNEFLDLRLMPKAGFYSHYLTYYYTNRTSKSQRVETTVVEFPLLLKFKSMRRGNVRMYMVGGLTPGIEVSGKNDTSSSSESIPILKTNLSLDAGIGFDFYFPLFKFSPELRFTQGVVNLLGNDASIYKDPIGRLNTSTVGIYLIFQ